MHRIWKWIACALAVCLLFAGCSNAPAETVPNAAATPAEPLATAGKGPAVPESLDTQNGVPLLTVYIADDESYQDMDIESYVQGVLAGEMRNDWPMEALKAQAILARTFVLKFVSEKESKYPRADISTDVTEAQAYAENSINERIVRAVDETRGLVLSSGGELPYAWFHAHSGGQTELAKVGLEYAQAEPDYTSAVAGNESDKAPTTVKNWTARFSVRETGEACAAAGVQTGIVESVSIGETSVSGRAITLLVNGMPVSAPALRLQLDPTRFKSTLLSDVAVQDGEVVFRGSGYGHGVGMSQWGAYGMAEEGSTAEEIISHYFKNVDIVRLWE